MRRRQDEHGMSDAPYIIPDIVSKTFIAHNIFSLSLIHKRMINNFQFVSFTLHTANWSARYV